MALARQIATAPGLAFGGLMTYPAAGRAAEAEAWLADARAALAAAGLACERISSGGTPDMWRAGEDTSPPSTGPAPTSISTATRWRKASARSTIAR